MAKIVPNILLVMTDQMAAPALSVYGHKLVNTPNLETLAEQSVVFDNAYCNSPLCAPSRFSMLSGQLPSRIGAYDNASEFPSSVPTFAHYLRAMGYHTCLGGKMHFVGPDQLHGYEDRLTTDVYPSDFGWTPNWDRPEVCYSWFHNMLSVVEAGVYARTMQLDFDEEVSFQGVRKIYDLARTRDERPFLLTLSFTQPHDPYMTTQGYWDRYQDDDIDLPSVAPIPPDKRDPHSRRLYYLCGMDQYRINAEHVRNARHAYYAMMSYIDDQIGALLAALRATRLADNTIIVFTADHGDMLGERGMWYKMTFFEWASRVPLIVYAPWLFAPRRVPENVSLVDLLSTLLELAAARDEAPELVTPVDGHSLRPLLTGDVTDWPDTVLAEYMGEGALAPCFMVKRGRYKYVTCELDPPQLYDLETDPKELENLSGRSEHATTEQALASVSATRWDPKKIKTRVIQSQRRRLFLFQSLKQGHVTPWDFQPIRDTYQQYIRNHETLDDADRRTRIPYREAPPPDFGVD
ncbi:MAG: choline-sulfatase [Acidiferrobacterales bacterium]